VQADALLALFRDPRHVRGDCALVRSAIRKGWGISPEVQRAVADTARRLLGKPSTPHRAVLALSELLIELDCDRQRTALKALGLPLRSLRVHRRTRG
jgi:hypothetical protein